MNIHICADYDGMSEQAARIVAEEIHAKPHLVLCLPSGNTPQGMYRELIHMHRHNRLDFSKVKFFLLDEYWGLRADHPQSFRAFLWRVFLNYINVHPANVYLPNETYDGTVQRAGGIDLLICGIGVNGHIAFNEPGSALDSRTRIVELADSTIELMRSSFSPHELPHQAITMGLATILEARRIVLLASGSKKAQILAQAFAGEITTHVPASVLGLHSHLTVMADEEAAAIYRHTALAKPEPIG
ncbi:MAG: glucosamine-6-phosphate deaminase [Acidobacteria bacterium]|nr:MAG: glucosamine-6-phosphate deaminase [Acidobacteriota bacterium]